jgi:hypothetical protein
LEGSRAVVNGEKEKKGQKEQETDSIANEEVVKVPTGSVLSV